MRDKISNFQKALLALFEDDVHSKFSVDEVYAAMNHVNPISLSTIYRNINTLVKASLIRQSYTVNNTCFYELNIPTLSKHIEYLYPKKINQLTDKRIEEYCRLTAREVGAEYVDHEISVLVR